MPLQIQKCSLRWGEPKSRHNRRQAGSDLAGVHLDDVNSLWQLVMDSINRHKAGVWPYYVDDTQHLTPPCARELPSVALLLCSEQLKGVLSHPFFVNAA